MRLLKIGRDAACDITLHSDKVSSLHAEVTILNNGDILLEDKNSRNGTYIMNKPIKPGVAVSVRRGDAIRFGDVELMWNQIPMPENNSNFKALYGIGTNFRNEIQISGNTVSRFHATLKIGRDGKAYLQDHSKNGTTVNGTRIASGQNIRIKRNDAVVCGGVPVNLKQFIPTGGILTKIVAAAAIAAVIVGIAFVIPRIIKPEPSLKALQDATACVYGEYYIEVTLEDDPFIDLLGGLGWPSKWVFGRIGNSTQPVLGTLTNNKISPFAYTGTAFFISEDGYLGTNRHIAIPWELSKKDDDMVKQEMQKALNNTNNLIISILNKAIESGILSVEDAKAYLARLQKSTFKIGGRHSFFGIACAGKNVSNSNDFMNCQVIDDSKNKDIDVALIRLNDAKTPESIIKGGFFNIKNARTDETTLTPLEEELITIGYPSGFNIGFFTENATTLLPTTHKLTVSKKADNNQFQFQGLSIGGQSGSPIIDEDRRLVGVLYGGFSKTEISYGCNIKHLVELYNKHAKK
ncbi:MAG: FHA domain-containing protein [Bacteroidaceae bacterium]|nr:FHA domain-containing protein [Bacteroidaceae bacterium]